jgi:putative resolvase
MLVSIGEAALLCGVSVSTLRRWDKDGFFKSQFKTKGGHRRYSFLKIEEFIGEIKENQDRITIAYARVSSHDQKDDLKRQVDRLDPFCKSNAESQYEVISDCSLAFDLTH